MKLVFSLLMSGTLLFQLPRAYIVSDYFCAVKWGSTCISPSRVAQWLEDIQRHFAQIHCSWAKIFNSVTSGRKSLSKGHLQLLIFYGTRDIFHFHMEKKQKKMVM